MTPIYDVHDTVKQAHVLRSAYLAQLLKTALKALQGVLTTHKGMAHSGHTSAAA